MSHEQASIVNPASEVRSVYGVICDLMFGSQIRGAVEGAGLNYLSLRSSVEILNLLSGAETEAVRAGIWIVNLAAKSPSEPEIVSIVLPQLIQAGVPLVCYAPHVEEHRMEWAQKLGAHNVVPRGALIKTLGTMLLQN